MVRIVNGEVVNSTPKRRSKGPLDLVASYFWSLVSFFVLFFKTILKPSEGGRRITSLKGLKTWGNGRT